MLKKVKILLLLVSLSISVCLMSNTYSRYVAQTDGSVDMMLANWQILVSKTDVTTNANANITFEPTIVENANVANNKVAPTSTGYFDIEIDPSNVDVSFKYTIDMAMQNSNVPDLIITKYAMLPNNYIEGDSLTYNILDEYSITNTLLYDNTITNFKFEKFTIRVYFEWYEGKDENMNDEQDTSIGTSINDEVFTINADVSFEQVL